MIRATNQNINFLTTFASDRHVGAADAPESKGGTGLAFSPLDLLEASLACCMNITLRVYAQTHDLDLSKVEVQVARVQEGGGSTFKCTASFPENVDAEQRKRLLAAMKGCPIHGILSHPINFTFSAED